MQEEDLSLYKIRHVPSLLVRCIENYHIWKKGGVNLLFQLHKNICLYMHIDWTFYHGQTYTCSTIVLCFTFNLNRKPM